MRNINLIKINFFLKQKKLKKLINHIKKEFFEYGIIKISNLPFKKNEIQKFTDYFTTSYSNDANRRINKFKNTKINTVDLGNHFIPLHSEASFTYSCPELIWFYCSKTDKSSSPTTICDGKKLWNELENSTKQFFLKNPIKYEVEIDIPFRKEKNTKQRYFSNKIGVYDSYIDWKKGKFNFKIIKYAINEEKKTDSFYFANHILVGSKHENQIKKMTLLDDKKIPKSILIEITELSEEHTKNYYWKKNKLLMINNKRFMHGRKKFNQYSQREILNIQSIKINI